MTRRTFSWALGFSAALEVLACSAGPRRPEPAPTATRVEDIATVRVPAGTFVQGSDDAERADERPARRVTVRAFVMDATLVTRSAFARFVELTKYVTTAERLGFGMGSREGMEDWAWERIPHASWRAPFVPGTPESDAFLREDAPVVMVSYDDGSAYCAYEGKRLPSEAEWEYAMRAGREGTRFPWGNGPENGGRLGLNFWQGQSHRHNDRLRCGFSLRFPRSRFFPAQCLGDLRSRGQCLASGRPTRSTIHTPTRRRHERRSPSAPPSACFAEGLGGAARAPARGWVSSIEGMRTPRPSSTATAFVACANRSRWAARVANHLAYTRRKNSARLPTPHFA